MEKGLGFLVVLLIWGGLLYILFYNTSFTLNFLGNSSLASSLSSFRKALNSQKEIIGIFNKDGDFENATIHFNKKIDILDIKISPQDPKLIFAGSNQGMFVSRDGGLNWYSFLDVEHKIDSYTRIYKILFDSSEMAFISTFQNNKGIVYKTQNNFFSLEKIFELDGEAIYDFDVSGSNLYLGLSDGRLLVYSLDKNEFQVLTTLNSAITNLKVGRGNNGLIYLTLKSGGFWKSENGGKSFSRMTFLDNYSGANKIQNFLVGWPNNSLIYAATQYGLIRTLDGGNSWQFFKSFPAEKSTISALALKPNPGEIFTASNGKIYINRDHSLNWQIFNSELIDREISVISPNGDKIIIGTKK